MEYGDMTCGYQIIRFMHEIVYDCLRNEVAEHCVGLCCRPMPCAVSYQLQAERAEVNEETEEFYISLINDADCILLTGSCPWTAVCKRCTK
jgi:hypothetical protein